MTGQCEAPADISPARAADRANRDFLRRAVRWLTAEAGVRQFLGFRSGAPAEPDLRELAGAAAPEARVAYLRREVTCPESVLDAPELSDALDLGRPVALTVNALFPFVPDGRDPYGILRELLNALPADSYLVLTHGGRAEVERFFEGLEPVGPGIVVPQRWRTDAEPPRQLGDSDIPGYAGVARKP